MTQVEQANAFMSLSGEPEQVAAFFRELSEKATFKWQIDAQADAKDIRFVRVKMPAGLAYRVIGGLIFNAQRRHLQIAFDVRPPICDPRDEE